MIFVLSELYLPIPISEIDRATNGIRFSDAKDKTLIRKLQTSGSGDIKRLQLKSKSNDEHYIWNFNISSKHFGLSVKHFVLK